jgi:proteasome lid subunit RPN8/RPN11
VTRPDEERLAALVPALIGEAERDPSREVCGLVLRSATGRLRLVPVANGSATPATAFELEPAALLARYRQMDAAGDQLEAIYHTHPSGGATLSSRDVEGALQDGRPLQPGVEQVVIALRHGRAVEIRAHRWGGAGYLGRRLWRAASDGEGMAP